MQSRIATLRQLVHGSLYVVDERAVADALVARAMIKHSVPQQQFPSEERWSPVRSFRRERGARSFRLCVRTPAMSGRR
ncbi:MAG: hypothetical protein M3018_04445 [Actinomycetota bacterium]|nr:hypothetical protein [Actinomycetota bacterium]